MASCANPCGKMALGMRHRVRTSEVTMGLEMQRCFCTVHGMTAAIAARSRRTSLMHGLVTLVTDRNVRTAETSIYHQVPMTTE